MKAKLMNLKNNGTWTSSDNAVFFKYEAEFEGGESGSFLSKSDPPIQKVGEEYEFEITEKGGHKNLKWTKPPFQRKSFDPAADATRQAMIVRQSSLKAATDLVCHKIVEYDDILLIAQRLTDWAIGDQKADKMKAPTDEMPY